jgi:hypothetical protein
MLFNEKQIAGITTELIVAQKFIELGYIVSIPYGNNSRYDMIVDTDNERYRIQVKHASLNENGSYTIQTCNSVSTMSKHERKYYTKQDIDFLVSIIQNQLVVIPVEMITKSASKIFRVELPKYGSKTNCNLIQNYTVERYMSK